MHFTYDCMFQVGWTRLMRDVMEYMYMLYPPAESVVGNWEAAHRDVLTMLGYPTYYSLMIHFQRSRPPISPMANLPHVAPVEADIDNRANMEWVRREK